MFSSSPPSLRRYIIDLEGYGRMFKRAIKDFGVSSEQKFDGQGYRSDADFVYNESASQILSILDGNIEQFFVKLQVLPDFKFFAHIQVFHSPLIQKEFQAKFLEFAFVLASTIHRVLGSNPEWDYLLETIADDYIIVTQVRKDH